MKTYYVSVVNQVIYKTVTVNPTMTNNEYEVNVEDSDDESEEISTYQSSIKYKCLKACWVILLPILVVIGILIAVVIVVGLIGGWITCFILGMIYPENVFFWLTMSPFILAGGIIALIVIGMVLFFIVTFTGMGIWIILQCIYKTIKSGLLAIDDYERECHQIEVHIETEIGINKTELDEVV